MNFYLRMNQLEIEFTPSTLHACQMMAAELQVKNKELGCECEGRIFKNVFNFFLTGYIGFGLFTEVVHQIMV
jgi:hypothetical protein